MSARFACILLIFGTLPSWCLAAGDVDATVQAAAAWRFGQSRGPVVVLEKLVCQASTDAAARRELAAMLANALAADATLEAKQVLCTQLSLIGSAAEVPTLAKLLSDKELGYFARMALERIAGDEAQAALQGALANTSGVVRAGIIESLAVRGDRRAVPELAKLLEASDEETVVAAIGALGRIGGAAAAKALLTADAGAPAERKGRIGEALLRCAGQLLAEGEKDLGAAGLARLVAPSSPSHLRAAAFPVYVRSLGEGGGQRIREALAGEDPVMRAAAVQALRVAGEAAWLRDAAGQLGRLAPEMQVQVITILGEHREADVLAAIGQAAKSQNPEVRKAAIEALGLAGNASTVAVLVELVGEGRNENAVLVTEALAGLHGTEIDGAMVEAMKTARPAGQVAIIRALVVRGSAAGPAVFAEAAQSTVREVRREAIVALGETGETESVVVLMGLLESDESVDVVRAMGAVCRRIGKVDAVSSQ